MNRPNYSKENSKSSCDLNSHLNIWNFLAFKQTIVVRYNSMLPQRNLKIIETFDRVHVYCEPKTKRSDTKNISSKAMMTAGNYLPSLGLIVHIH